MALQRSGCSWLVKRPRIMLFRKARRRNCGSGSVPVYLNVYDVIPINGYAYWLGIGVYHTGVQVHGVEYAFGASDDSSTGIFEGEPTRCEGFTFRKTILIGKTEMGEEDVRRMMEKLAGEYRGDAYNLITKNCNHFCKDVCLKLTGKSIPRWVNRLARIGLLCKCILPVATNSTRVRDHKTEDKQCEEEKKESSSSAKSVPSETSETIQMDTSSSTSETDNNKKKMEPSNSTSSPSSSTSPALRRGRSITRPDLPPPSSPVIIEPSSSSSCPNSEH